MKKIFIGFSLIIASAFSFFLGSRLNNQNVEPINKEVVVKNTSVSVCDEYIKMFDFSVPEIYEGEVAPVNFDSYPEARLYRTAITKQAADGPNFAGHYAVVTWGCGTECQGYAIVDSKTGDIVHYEPYIKFRVDAGISSSIDSTLLTLNPKTDNQDYLDSIRGWSVGQIIEQWNSDAAKARIHYSFRDGAVSVLCVENNADGEF